MTVKMTIHTTSTKCQYKPTISTTSAFSFGIFPLRDRFANASKHQDTDGYVRTVESGEDIEARTEQVRLERESFTNEGGELVHLASEERGTQQSGSDEPDAKPTLVTAANGRKGQTPW